MPDQRHRFATCINRHPEILSLGGLILLCGVMACISDRFLTWDYLSKVGRQVSINAIIANGMTLVILTGGIDLWFGAVMSLSMTLAAGSMLAGIPDPLAALIGLGTGAAFGALNGAVVADARLQTTLQQAE